MIVIINYGMGNLNSVLNMFKKVGAQAIITSDLNMIEKADKLMLPGVGAFDNAMANINNMGLIPVLNKKVLEDKIPILGICLGMQLLTKSSEEGNLQGLGWLDAETKRFNFGENTQNLKTPHMGWNLANIKHQKNIFDKMNGESKFYFVHSYHVVCCDETDILATTFYGYEFTSAVHKENIYGTQFHPEKSHKFGMQVLKNFTLL